MSFKKHAWVIFLVIAAVLFGSSFIIAQKAEEGVDEGVVITQHVKGNEASSVVVKEYGDFQCPACGQFYPVVKELIEEYGADIRFEYHHFPLVTAHPYAVPAARAAEAAGQQGKFWEMHDRLFENQATWSNAGNPAPFFAQYAEELGLDMDMYRKHLRSNLINQAIEDSFDEARELGFTGTPTFTLNGSKMEFSTYEDFKAQIVAAIGGEGTDAPTSSAGSDVQFGI